MLYASGEKSPSMYKKVLGFVLKYTKLGISSILTFVSFIVLVLVILGFSVLFSECEIFVTE